MSDELVERVLGGEKEAFREIVLAYGPAVRAFLAAHLSDRHMVDDMAQETFFAAYANLRKWRWGADMTAWLRGIARNKLNAYLRRHYTYGNVLERLQASVLQTVQPHLAQAFEWDDAETFAQLKACLEKLPDRLRNVVEARYTDRLKVMDIGASLGKSPNAVSSLLFRARKRLQMCMEGEEY